MKKVFSFVFILNVIISLSITVFGEGGELSQDFVSPSTEIDNNTGEDYGKAELFDALPDDVSATLEEYNISPDNGGGINLSVSDIFGYIWNSFLNETAKPLSLLFSLLGVVVLSSLLESMRDSTGSSRAAETFAMVSVITGAVMVSHHMSECVVEISGILSGAGTFMGTFIPIFAGIMAVTGQLASAGVFNSIMIFAIQLFTQVITAVLTPLTGAILGIAVAGAVNADLKIEKIADLIKKIVVWALGLTVTVFVGMLSMQTLVASSADSVTLKATKFLISNSVPIVGGAVGDALSTVNSSIGIIRAGTGTFGIIAGVFILLPSIVSAACYKLALAAAAAASDLFGVTRLSSLLKSGESVMSIVLALLISFTLLAVVSIALMLNIATGGGV